MENRNTEDIETRRDEDGDSSFYVGHDDKAQLDFEGLFSYPLTNIRLLYSSPNGPAEIYSATRYGRRYILKGLKEEYRNDPVYNLALAKEFEIGISLDHPYIRRTLDLEAVDNLGKVIVLEWIDGCSLKTLIDSGQLTPSSARSLAAQLTQALGYMHDKQIFHRDLKPSNILVAQSNQTIKIIDFSLSDSDDSIVLKNPAGSKKYMAPEQMAQKCSPSAVTDIYSLGVILNEIAEAANDEELSYVARKCSDPHPEKRPQSVADIKLPSASSTVGSLFSRFLSSKLLTYVMLAVCVTLAALVAYSLMLQ